MNPADFLELAGELIPRGTKAALRTAVSRAYYGAFHAAVALINEAGVSLPAGPEAHQKVRYCLMESGEVPSLQAGDSLQILRKHRNQADYDLRELAEFSATSAIQRIDRARETVKLLNQCRAEPIRTRFHTAVRRYANDVLRLPVTED